ncbi:hypothetical protein OBV_01270 [Oscillibacter valericigenes Sjm18-20]|nr:hypothetical protein OBV_01270 [Oscillibacter valericigenes Sjm18-20]
MGEKKRAHPKKAALKKRHKSPASGHCQLALSFCLRVSAYSLAPSALISEILQSSITSLFCICAVRVGFWGLFLFLFTAFSIREAHRSVNKIGLNYCAKRHTLLTMAYYKISFLQPICFTFLLPIKLLFTSVLWLEAFIK